MAGRPRIYDNADELDSMCEKYFTETVKPTISGLALYLGFADKSSLYDYKDRAEFFHPIKRALTRIEQFHEERLTENSVTGSIFALKNMGWKDKTEHELSGGIDHGKKPSWFEAT